jgi:hypothetical protein
MKQLSISRWQKIEAMKHLMLHRIASSVLLPSFAPHMPFFLILPPPPSFMYIYHFTFNSLIFPHSFFVLKIFPLFLVPFTCIPPPNWPRPINTPPLSQLHEI